jgi:hypothetical protein|tara:strand:- start:4214 stop:4465 length:252 start_codon:yes stop_codon:yes gene_type:complete
MVLSCKAPIFRIDAQHGLMLMGRKSLKLPGQAMMQINKGTLRVSDARVRVSLLSRRAHEYATMLTAKWRSACGTVFEEGMSGE